MVDVFDFGLRLRELRNSKKLSQPQLAEMLELTRASISSYENNIGYPSVETLIRFSNIFHVSVDYLLGLEHQRTLVVHNMSERQLELIDLFIDFIITECPGDPSTRKIP